MQLGEGKKRAGWSCTFGGEVELEKPESGETGDRGACPCQVGLVLGLARGLFVTTRPLAPTGPEAQPLGMEPPLLQLALLVGRKASGHGAALQPQAQHSCPESHQGRHQGHLYQR